MDREGEFALFETLQRLKLQKVTTFIISHRLSIIRFVDLILCLQQGRIKEFGPRDEVIEQIKKEAEAQKMAQPAKTVA